MTTVDSVMGSRAGATLDSDYAQLSTRVKEAGLLDRRSGYYTVKIVATVLTFIGGWVAFALIGASW